MSWLEQNPAWLETIQSLTSAGLITLPQQIGETTWAASAPFGWGCVAKEAARTLGGFVMPSASGGAAWKCGRGPMNGVLLDMDKAADILRAREVVRALIPPADRPNGIPWSYGALARMLLVWAVKPQGKDMTCETLITADGDIREYMYHDCEPGLYPSAVMWDGGSYFFNFLRRMPSLRVSLGRGKAGGRNGEEGSPGRFRWQKMSADERSQWADVLDACAETKILRNSLWGASLGSLAGRLAYTSSPPKGADGKRVKDWEKGRVRDIHPVFGPGPFRPMALILARCAAELTQIASEEVGSVYSTVDSVTSIDGREPAIWGRVGLPYGIKQEGEAHIVQRGCWRIAGNPTDPYCPMKKIAKEGRKLTSWVVDKPAALVPGYVPRLPQTPVPRACVNNYYYTQWL